METLVLMEALAEVTGVMRDGAQLLFSKITGSATEGPFSDLDRAGKVGLLEAAIDWNPYFDCGMEPEQAERIIENAADGKPQDRWLEPLGKERANQVQPTFAGLLQSYARPTPVSLEMEHVLER